MSSRATGGGRASRHSSGVLDGFGNDGASDAAMLRTPEPGIGDKREPILLAARQAYVSHPLDRR